MANNVIFKTGTKAQYNALAVKDSHTLYWLSDVLELWKGEELYGKGAMATSLASGLMSAEDKQKLDSLANFTAVSVVPLNSSVSVSEADGKTYVGVNISSAQGNIIQVNGDGLFAAAATSFPEFSIEKQGDAEDGFAASYKLKRTFEGEVSYVGDTINIPRDLVVKSGSLETVVEEGVPYSGAVVGESYIDLVLSDAEGTHIYIPLKDMDAGRFYAGKGIEIVNDVISVKLSAVGSNGLFFDKEDGLGINIASRESAGAMSPEDKLVVDSLPYAYERVKYEIAYKPEGTIVDYRDKEIRVMCPSNTVWTKQEVGANGDSNMYYMGFKAYAPEDAVSFKEDDKDIIEDQTMYYFEDNDFAGIDEFGRKYSIVWLALATYDETTDSWSYFGEKSSEERYIGWYYSVEWYNENGVMIDSDMIRISLSNESCHDNIMPYYLNGFVSSEELEEVQNTVAEMEESFTWGDM